MAKLVTASGNLDRAWFDYRVSAYKPGNLFMQRIDNMITTARICSKEDELFQALDDAIQRLYRRLPRCFLAEYGRACGLGQHVDHLEDGSSLLGPHLRDRMFCDMWRFDPNGAIYFRPRNGYNFFTHSVIQSEWQLATFETFLDKAKLWRRSRNTQIRFLVSVLIDHLIRVPNSLATVLPLADLPELICEFTWPQLIGRSPSLMLL